MILSLLLLFTSVAIIFVVPQETADVAHYTKLIPSGDGKTHQESVADKTYQESITDKSQTESKLKSYCKRTGQMIISLMR